MANKRKIIYEDEEDEDVGDNNGSSFAKGFHALDATEAQPGACATIRDIKLTHTVAKAVDEPAGKRRSGRTGKGSGGRLTQLRTLERIQTEQPVKRPSRADIATQGEEINPMAPSSQDTGERKSRRRRVDSGPLDTNEFQSQSYVPNGSSLPTPQPVFSLATPGQQFGFRLPDVQASQTADTNQSTGQLTTEVNAQAPSRTRFRGVASRSSSSSASVSSRSTFFSAGSSRLQGTSTAPTSSASSVCSTSEPIHPPPASGVTQHLLRPRALSEPSFHDCPDPTNSMSNKSILSRQCAPQDYSAQLPSTMHHLASTRLVTVLPLCLGSMMMGVQSR